MGAIIQRLQDVGWWFDYVVASGVVALVIGLVVIRVDRRITSASSAFRKYRIRRKERYEEFLEACVRDPYYLVVQWFEAVIGAMALCVLALTVFALRLIVPVESANAAPVDQLTGPERWWAVATVIIGGLCIGAITYIAVRSITLARAGFKRYRDAKHLPRVPLF
jgi:hypothetical protein